LVEFISDRPPERGDTGHAKNRKEDDEEQILNYAATAL
jgi:hypothetical protein